jgi:hypothetical protein
MEQSPGPALGDEQLSEMLDGVAPERVVKQVAHDPAAAARLHAWQRWNEQMQAQLQRWDCPPPQHLADYHWGIADRHAAQIIAQHLPTCVRCSSEIESLRTFLDADEPQPSAPRTSPPSLSPGVRLRERIASLLPRTPTLAVRGEHRAPLLAQAGDVLLVLDVEPTSDQFVVHGQVAADDLDRWTGALVEVRQDGVVRGVAEVDDVASFRCGPLAAGVSELRITAPDGTSVVLQDVDLGNSVTRGQGDTEIK